MNEEFEMLKGEMTPVPGFPDYLAHCLKGKVWSNKTNRWLLQDAKGTGDDNRYLKTALSDSEGNLHHMYLSEIIMSSSMGVPKSYWRAMGLEVDHIDNTDTKNNSIENLRLVSSADNKKNSRYRFWNKVRLSMDVAKQLRQDFKELTGSKVEWYRMKGKELGVSARSIQNIILGYTYKEATE